MNINNAPTNSIENLNAVNSHKKVWVKPEVELISQGVIQSGNAPSNNEGSVSQLLERYYAS